MHSHTRTVARAAAAVTLQLLISAYSATAQDCTNGRLFVTETGTGTLHVFNADASGWPEVANFATAAPAASVSVATYATEQGDAVALVNGGTAAANYSDGSVRFFTAGLDGAAADTVAQHSYAITCTRPIHFTSTSGWISVFCDGYYSSDAAFTTNSTVYFLNENHFSHSAALDAFNWKLPGQQHGVGWALDEDHFLYSEATDARVGRVSGSTSSPAGFTVAYRNGTIVHDLNSPFDTHSSCAGFHGESHAGSVFAFGCDHATDVTHDGLLVVTKNEHTETYASRKLGYPAFLAGTGRTGTLQANARSGWFVGNFGSNFVLAFTGTETATAVPANAALNITGACGWGLEQSYDSYAFTLMPSGELNAYSLSAANGFTFVKAVRVFDGPISCTGNFVLKGGWGGAWIARRDVPSVTFVNIPLGTATTKGLSFSPNQLVLAAETPFLCAACPTCRAGNGNTNSNSAASGAAGVSTIVSALLALTVAIGSRL